MGIKEEQNQIDNLKTLIHLGYKRKEIQKVTGLKSYTVALVLKREGYPLRKGIPDDCANPYALWNFSWKEKFYNKISHVYKRLSRISTFKNRPPLRWELYLFKKVEKAVETLLETKKLNRGDFNGKDSS